MSKPNSSDHIPDGMFLRISDNEGKFSPTTMHIRKDRIVSMSETEEFVTITFDQCVSYGVSR